MFGRHSDDAIPRLAQSIECLCSNVGGLRGDLAKTQAAIGEFTAEAAALKARLQRIDGRLDGLERWAADHLPEYPRDRHPNSATLAVVPITGRAP